MKRWKTASNASGRSLARCWLKAEADDEPACRPKKSSSSILVPEEPQETRKEMSLSALIFLERVKSADGTGRILGDVGYDMADGVSKSSFDVFM